MGQANRGAILESLPDMSPYAKIVSAKKDFHVAATPTDIKGAIALNPAECAFARACTRRGKPALFFRNVAYVKQSSRLIYKYSLDSNTKALVKMFDTTGIMPSQGITLHVPTGKVAVGGRTGDLSHGYQGKAASAKTIAARKAGREALAAFERKL